MINRNSRFKMLLKFLAILDIIFCEKFILVIYKNGVPISKTKLEKHESI